MWQRLHARTVRQTRVVSVFQSANTTIVGHDWVWKDRPDKAPCQRPTCKGIISATTYRAETFGTASRQLEEGGVVLSSRAVWLTQAIFPYSMAITTDIPVDRNCTCHMSDMSRCPVHPRPDRKSDSRWEKIRKDFLESIEALDKKLGFSAVDPRWVVEMKKAYQYVESRSCD
jgi:hypothetical protein